MQNEGNLERKYALTKIAPGDYLLPSNDGQTLWRIRRYTDGPSFGLEDMPRDRQFWGVWRWIYSLHAYEVTPESLDDGAAWEMRFDWLETRAEAIKAALATR